MKMIKRSFSLLLVLTMILSMTLVAQASGKTYYTVGKVALRSGPGTEFSAITTLDKNTKVTVTGQNCRDGNSVKWDRVTVGGHSGWVMYAAISGKKNGDTYKGTVELTQSEPVRKKPSTSGKRVTTAKKGNVYKYYDSVTDSNGRLWLMVKIGGKVGWISSRHTNITSK